MQRTLLSGGDNDSLREESGSSRGVESLKKKAVKADGRDTMMGIHLHESRAKHLKRIERYSLFT